jgi:predicted metal-dependent HD superfamily phosphohydrolase
MQEILDKWGIKIDYNMILSMWNESHRYYHTQNHLLDLIEQINEKRNQLPQKDYEKLIITALFHDIVYDPTRSDNEEKSAQFLMESVSDKENSDILEIKQMILDTKSHNPETELSKMFCEMDMSIVEGDFEKLLDWEKGISQEFKVFGPLYKEGRLKFLESLIDNYPTNAENIMKLIDWVKINY